MAHTFGKAIFEILTNTNQSVGNLDLSSQRDLEQIQRWNLAFPGKVNACVHDLLLKFSTESPQSPVLCSWDGSLTYHELERLSLRLASHLVSIGVASEVLVPYCFKKSMYAVVAMVAILRAGGVLVPLDPSHPKDRLKEIVQKTNARIIVAAPDTAYIVESMATTTVSVSSSMLESLPVSIDFLIPEVRPHNAAFVLFTSGSTGTPKGIVQEHASVCTSSIAHGRALNVTSKSRVLQYAAYTFDVSMMDIFTTLIYGGCVCIPSEEDRMNNFTMVMNRMHVNWVLFTPSVARLISPEDVPELKTLVFGGEAVQQENVTPWIGKVRLFNCYGPAECGACSISEITQKSSRPGNIGQAFGCGSCWVVDPANHNRILPVGAVGELLVEGPTLARGYLDDLVRTRDAFIKCPSWPLRAGPYKPRRLYKTGDLVRYNSDGTFEFVGRKDFQHKIRGQRIELGEVEHHLSTFPGVALSIAAVPQHGSYSKSLVGVLQLHQQNGCCTKSSTTMSLKSKEHLVAMNFDEEDLLRFLKSKLPSYMVPTHLLVVNRLPLSASCKIDRKAVNTWLACITRTYEPPAANLNSKKSRISEDDVIAFQISAKVASMFAQLDSAFHKTLHGQDFPLATVGLDSIQLISLLMFLRQRFGVRVRLDSLVDPKATVRSVANCIKGLLTGGPEHAIEPAVDIMEVFWRYPVATLDGFSKNGAVLHNVLITGATGFLGSQILSRLCSQANIRKIVVLVRGDSAQHGLQRIIKSAILAGWWADHYTRKLEVWVGDLAKAELGLASNQWRYLCGTGSPTQRITAVIHNGAAVNWNATFSSLKAANVNSTVELLRAASESTAMSNFVFICGGQELKVGEDNEVEIAEAVAQSNGYAQTKFLSELIVKEYSRTIARNGQQVSIVKPGYIIGTVQEGIACVDDYIWRLTASSIAIKGYNGADANSWLFISDVDRVAAAVVGCCNVQPDHSRRKAVNVIKILDGVTVGEFWDVLRCELGYELFALSQDSWMDKIHRDIENKGEAHPLWPLLHTLEKGKGKLGSLQAPQNIANVDKARVKAAVKRNIEYLGSVGYLSKPYEENCVSKCWKGFGFTRSSYVASK